MQSKRLCISLIILLIILSFIGCSSKKERKIRLTIALCGNATELKQKRYVMKLFEAEHPGVKVIIQHTPYSQLQQKIKIQMASGTPPDIMWILCRSFLDFVTKGVFIPIQEFVDQDKEINLGDYYSATLKPYIYKGELYGLPPDMDFGVIAYNKKLFPEGMEYPNENWDWDDLLESAQKLTKDFDNDGRIDQFGLGVPWATHLFILQNGGSFLNSDKTECTINSPEAIESLQFCVDLVEKYHVSPQPRESADLGIREMFEMGKIAMLIDGFSPVVGRPKNKEVMDLDLAPLPIQKRKVTFLNTAAWCISSKCKNKEIAWELLKYCLGKEGVKRMLNAPGWHCTPAIRSIAESPLFLKDKPEGTKKCFQQMEYAEYPLLCENQNEIGQIIRMELNNIWQNRSTIPEVCTKIKSRVDKVLKRKH